jgi:hypothetical protein
VGILTEQAEALAGLLEPLGVALTGPLHDLFVSALLCQDLAEPPGHDSGPAGPAADPPPPPSTLPPVGHVVGGPIPKAPLVLAEVPASGVGSSPASQSATSLVSAVPAPLRGPAVAAAMLFAAAGAWAFRRLLSPRRPSSLLDQGPADP